MVVALHAGSNKPEGIFKRLVDESERFDAEPLEIMVNDQKKKFYVRLLLVIADAPARADLLKSKQHNAHYGCNWCYVRTKYEADQKSVRYPLITGTSSDCDEKAEEFRLSSIPSTSSTITGEVSENLVVIRAAELDCIHEAIANLTEQIDALRLELSELKNAAESGNGEGTSFNQNIHYVGRHRVPINILSLTSACAFGIKPAAVVHLLDQVFGQAMMANKSWQCFTQLEQTKIGDVLRYFLIFYMTLDDPDRKLPKSSELTEKYNELHAGFVRYLNNTNYKTKVKAETKGTAPPTKQPRLTNPQKTRRTKNVKEPKLSVESIVADNSFDVTGIDFQIDASDL